MRNIIYIALLILSIGVVNAHSVNPAAIKESKFPQLSSGTSLKLCPIFLVDTVKIFPILGVDTSQVFRLENLVFLPVYPNTLVEEILDLSIRSTLYLCDSERNITGNEPNYRRARDALRWSC